jgi:hypothetical protein
MSYSRQKTLGRYGRQLGPPTITSYTFPASTGGVNAVDSLIAMPPQDCLYTFNIMPSEYGLRLRKGYREWATGCVENPQRAPNVDVKTIIPFESKVQDVANDRLFAATSEGIWDVTLFNTTAPVQEVVFTQTQEPAGYGVWAEFTGDAAGDGLRGHYLFYADGLNGIWQYEEATDLWTQPPSGVAPTDWFYITGTDTINAFPVENVAFVMVFKQRIWVVLEDEDDAWYLPTASVTGELKKFTFGSKMPHGGNLMGLWNWTVDGGSGVDDLMVAVSRGGDVIVYKGEDPEITPDGTSQGPWSTVGTWFIGTVPESRRIVTDYGPDLYVLSSFGLESLNNLLKGAPEFGQNISAKVNRFLRADVKSGEDSSAWQVTVHPGDGFLQIITPKPVAEKYVQYNLNLQTQAWGFWEGVPIFGADSWNGDYFMGGEDGVVYINDGTLDGTQIGVEGSVGDAIEFRTLTSFQAPAGHSNFNRVGIIRAIGLLTGAASLNIKAVYDYNIEDRANQPVQPGNPGQYVWDSAIWDAAIWDFTAQGQSFTFGTLGVGRTFAVSMSGNSQSRLTVIGWDCLYNTGGYM